MTNPTPEQIEAAAEAIRERSTWPSMHWPDIRGVDHLDTSKALALAALVAAAGVTPQEREDDNLARASAWSDYRAEYGVHGAQSHRDFCAGWDAARGTLDTGRGQR